MLDKNEIPTHDPRILFHHMNITTLSVMLNINPNMIRRSKFDPLWNIFLVGGMQDDEPFLGYVNLQGNCPSYIFNKKKHCLPEK